MSPKRQILMRCIGKISGNHETMDTGVDHERYLELVGQNKAYQDIHDFVTDDLVDDDDAETGELEDLPT